MRREKLSLLGPVALLTCLSIGLLIFSLLGQPAAPPNPLRLVTGPVQSVTVVTVATPNSFPLPLGVVAKTCIVTRNIAQSPGVDYNIIGNAVVFVYGVNAGDVVQLNCW
jgi:hypothetical protein